MADTHIHPVRMSRHNGESSRSTVIPDQFSYQRDLGFSAGPGAGDEVVISAVLHDPRHEIRLTLRIDPEGTILEAQVSEEQTPLQGCGRLEELAPKLEGLDIRRTSAPELRDEVLGQGCFHLWELAAPAFRFATNVLAMCRVGWRAMNPPGPETPDKMREAGLDRCVAFEDAEFEENPRT